MVRVLVILVILVVVAFIVYKAIQINKDKPVIGTKQSGGSDKGDKTKPATN